MGRKGKKGRATKNQVQTAADEEPDELAKAPHTFVIYRGRLGKSFNELMMNFRKVMEPFTASKLKVQKRNAVKDFVTIAGLLHVSHLIVFTKTEQAMYMRIIRLPRGPTLTFKINNYALARDVLSSIKRRVTYASQFSNHPLMVLNNFSGEGLELKLMTSMFQSMFPSININKVKLNGIRRCLLMNYNTENKTIDFRHYTIKVVPSGLNRSVKKLIQSKIPDLGRLNDISQLMEKGGIASESEAEPDGPFNQVTLTQKIASRGNQVSQQSAIRLVELGPRMTLELVKIEEGVMEGEVLYHSHVHKTPEEVKELKKKREKQTRLKAQRKQTQQENKAKKQKGLPNSKRFANPAVEEDSDEAAMEDANWYEKETGEKPAKELFPTRKRKSETEAAMQKTKEARFDKTSGDGGRINDGSKIRSRKIAETKGDGVKEGKGIQEILKRRKKRKETQKKKASTAAKTAAVAAKIRKMKRK